MPIPPHAQGELAAGRTARALAAVCLVLFPLLFLPAGTSIHPSLGEDTSGQVRGLADQASQWRLVHLMFGLAALLALGAVVAIWRLTAAGLRNSPELRVLTAVGGVIGVAGAVALVWVAGWETRVVPELARACVDSEGCLAASNRLFVERLATVGWRQVPFLLEGGVLLALGLFVLGPLAWWGKALRPWEAAGISLGALLLLVLAPSIHARNTAGLLLVLVGTGSLALRLLLRRESAPMEASQRP